MLRFFSLRRTLSDRHLMDYLWRRIAPWFIGRFTTNRQAIATHYEFDNDLAVNNDRHSYFLTCKAWAENLGASRDEIIRRWGEALYRRFRLYLWRSAYAFLNRGMEAYRVILERPREV